MVAAFAPDPAPDLAPEFAPDRRQPPGGPRRHLYVVPSSRSPVRPRRHSPAVARRRRIVAVGAPCLVLVALWLAVRTADGPGTGVAASRPTAARLWVVHPGDTLWAIALATGDGGDIRAVVDELSAEVHDQPLQVGERIPVP